MVIFHSYVAVHQRVSPTIPLYAPYISPSRYPQNRYPQLYPHINPIYIFHSYVCLPDGINLINHLVWEVPPFLESSKSYHIGPGAHRHLRGLRRAVDDPRTAQAPGALGAVPGTGRHGEGGTEAGLETWGRMLVVDSICLVCVYIIYNIYM